MSSVLYTSRIAASPGMDSPGTADADRRDRASIEIIGRMRDPTCPVTERRLLREQVVRWNLAMARGLASRYQHRGETLDDLIQVAALALVKAVDGYDPQRGHSFTGYATPTILGELKRHFRDRVWAVHVPRRLQERCLEVTRTRAELAQRLNHVPSAAEIATSMGVTEAEVHATEASVSAYRADSLNRPVGGKEGAAERQDLLGCRDGSLEELCDRLTVRAVVDRLPRREREVIEGYFFGDRTQAQLAAELRTSQMNVSRLVRRTLAQLHDHLTEDADSTPRQTRPNSGRLRVRTHQVRPGYLVAAVRGRVDDQGAADLRDALVDLAVTHRPPTLIVDFRHAEAAVATVAGALLDAYRAGGHTGTRLCVVNVPAQLHALLCRTGLHRLFACRPVTGSAVVSRDAPVPPTDPVPDVPRAEAVRSLRSGEGATATTSHAAASWDLVERWRRSMGHPCRPVTTAGRCGTVGPTAHSVEIRPVGATARPNLPNGIGCASAQSGLTRHPLGSNPALSLTENSHQAASLSFWSWRCHRPRPDGPARRSRRWPRPVPRSRPPPRCRGRRSLQAVTPIQDRQGTPDELTRPGGLTVLTRHPRGRTALGGPVSGVA